MQNVIELSGDKNEFGNVVMEKFEIFEMEKNATLGATFSKHVKASRFYASLAASK